jgi:gluconolactonase
MASTRDLRTIVEGLDHPEGVAYGPDRMLYAGGEAGQIYRIDPTDGTFEQIADTGGFILGVCLDGAGAVYACDASRAAVVRVSPDGGAVEDWCASAGGQRLKLPNWAAFAPDGALWFSDSGTEDVDAVDGRLIRVPVGGGDGEALDLEPLHFPNGLCVGLDGTTYWVESYTPRLRMLRDGRPETIAELPGVVPDGVALDAEGGFLVSCYYPFRLLRVPPRASEPEVLLDDPQGQSLMMPTNAAYYGDELDTIAIAQLGGWSLKALGAPVRGAPLHYPVPA